jgi:hypothetical protein
MNFSGESNWDEMSLLILQNLNEAMKQQEDEIWQESAFLGSSTNASLISSTLPSPWTADEARSTAVSPDPSAYFDFKTNCSSYLTEIIANVTNSMNESVEITPVPIGVIPLPPFPGKNVIIPLYTLIFFLSFIGNFLVILTLFKNRRMRTVTNVLLLNLVRSLCFLDSCICL